MKSRYWCLVAMLLAGCAPAATSAVGGFAIAPASLSFAEPDGVSSAAPGPIEPLHSVIVRTKPGQVPATPPSAVSSRALGEPDAMLFEAADPAARDRMLAELAADPAVDLAEADQPLTLEAVTMNDPFFAKQWDLPKIGMPDAWAVTRGRTDVIVAVIDSGVDAKHPDLVGQIIAGPDLYNRDADPSDDNGHGTHVAGTIVAKANNALGVSGMAPGCRALAIKVTSASGSASTTTLADAITQSVTRGAKVIDMSLAGPAGTTYLRDAVARAQAAGVVVVAGAGNNNTTAAYFPAGYPGVLSVGATTPTDDRATFSNHGTTVNIAAPGTGIYSTKHGSYLVSQGTSMAAPHVAAAAALLRSRHPTWSVDAVRQALTRTGAPVRGFTGNAALRRLDVRQALAYVPTATPAPVASAAPAPTPAPTVRPTATPTPVQTPTPAPSTAPTPTPVSATAFTYLQLRTGTPYSLVVSWNTNVPTTGEAWIGTSTATLMKATQVTAEGAGTTSQTITLNGLRPDTAYVVQIRTTGASPTTSVAMPGRTGRIAVTQATVGGITATSANATWTTNVPVACQLSWGTTPTTLDRSLPLETVHTTSHKGVMTGLQPRTTYYFQFRSADTTGNTTVSPTWTFSTP